MSMFICENIKLLMHVHKMTSGSMANHFTLTYSQQHQIQIYQCQQVILCHHQVTFCENPGFSNLGINLIKPCITGNYKIFRKIPQFCDKNGVQNEYQLSTTSKHILYKYICIYVTRLSPIWRLYWSIHSMFNFHQLRFLIFTCRKMISDIIRNI